jgi:hypothetical protein
MFSFVLFLMLMSMDCVPMKRIRVDSHDVVDNAHDYDWDVFDVDYDVHLMENETLTGLIKSVVDQLFQDGNSTIVPLDQ